MSGTAKEAERAQALRHRAAQGDKEALAELNRGENAPDAARAEPHDAARAEPHDAARAEPHDVGTSAVPPLR